MPSASMKPVKAGAGAGAGVKSKKRSKTVLKERAAKDEMIELTSPKSTNRDGVIYLGHIPHGFYEKQMRGFFEQFGTVLRLRLSRSKKSSRSKGYAFIQFDSNEVAQIVEKTMHKYILMGRHLECEVVPPSRVHERMFAGCDREFRNINWRKIAMNQHNKTRTVEQEAKRSLHLLNKENKLRLKLASKGFDYDFPGYSDCIDLSEAEEEDVSDRAEDEESDYEPVVPELREEFKSKATPIPSKKEKKRKSLDIVTEPAKSSKKQKKASTEVSITAPSSSLQSKSERKKKKGKAEKTPEAAPASAKSKAASSKKKKKKKQ